jgi:nucleotide-binding universal stress UspA family protein
MDIKRILFPTDFAECSSAALDCASCLTSATGARLYILHVDELRDVSVPAIPPAEGGFFYAAAWDDERREAMQDRLTKTVPTVDNVPYEHRLLTGSPLMQILQFAEQESVDLIIMGSHGRTGLSKLVMGSIAQGVMRDAKCPVLIVKQPTAVTNNVGNTVTSRLPH